MFRTLLIANRGEIACRVIRSAKKLGLRTVAVYSDADRDALHLRQADEALRIGPAEARASYLNIDAILAAAGACGAQAIHPGYGFLSENAEFAAACERAGIVFVGPTPAAIAAMGDKAAAKRRMEKAGVPLVPGYHGEAQDAARLLAEAKRIGFPVLVKASAGGGGKGMRIVGEATEFGAALESAQREAASAFGDARVLLERYLERPRHIEIQVFGDTHGNLVHLFERDCSVQRRHQKVLEEAPAPGMPEDMRARLSAAALAAARAIDYVGAGTVEFIAGTERGRAGALSGEFFFMEMNTRLQVEHPVTEMVTGLDLVEWQLRVAAGEPLPLAQDAIALRGHAIEARLYAEDPGRDFLPAPGRLVHLAFPAAAPDLRIETGVESGALITAWYDPMIAKLVAWGENRPAARARLAAAFRALEIAGPATNAEFLARVLASRAFGAAELDTGLIERNRAELLPVAAAPAPGMLAAAACAELFEEAERARAQARAAGDPHSPWHGVDGWRLNEVSHHDFVFAAEDGAQHRVTVRLDAAARQLVIEGRACALESERLAATRLRLSLDGRSFEAQAVREGRLWHLRVSGAACRLRLVDELAAADEDAGTGLLVAPMPGRIVALPARKGERVQAGAPLVVLEAMKMEHTLVAPADGVVSEVRCCGGEQVAEGRELIVFEPD